jgi:eukaryotic-like serine/threonine-protein kinase
MQPKPVESAVSDESLIAKRYKVLTKIGEGGVGQVLKCYDSVLHNIVAVKMLHSHASDYEMARFHREAKATAKLDHANIVKILDFGQTDEGRPFLVMEFVDGKSIADLLLERGPLATETMLPIFRQVCAGLQYAQACETEIASMPGRMFTAWVALSSRLLREKFLLVVIPWYQ